MTHGPEHHIEHAEHAAHATHDEFNPHFSRCLFKRLIECRATFARGSWEGRRVAVLGSLRIYAAKRVRGRRASIRGRIFHGRALLPSDFVLARGILRRDQAADVRRRP